MKKHFYIILFTLVLSVSAYSQDRFPDTEILRSGGSGITFKFVTPEYKVKPVNIGGKTYSRFIFENLEYTSEVGYPELPYRTILIALPPEGEYTLTVTDRSTDELKDTYPAPVPGFKKEQDNFPVFEHKVDNDLYRSSKPFKENLYEVETISSLTRVSKVYKLQYASSISYYERWIFLVSKRRISNYINLPILMWHVESVNVIFRYFF